MNSYGGMINARDDQLRQFLGREPPETTVSELRASKRRPRRARVMNTLIDWKAVDLVVFSVNLMRSHWVLVLLDVEGLRFLYFDSFLSGDICGAVPIMRRWVCDDIFHQLGEATAAGLGLDNWLVVNELVPRQLDTSSCGLFALMCANPFSMRFPLSFSQEDMPAIRQRLSVDLLLDRIEWIDEEAVVSARQ